MTVGDLLCILNTEYCVECDGKNPDVECQECFRWVHQECYGLDSVDDEDQFICNLCCDFE